MRRRKARCWRASRAARLTSSDDGGVVGHQFDHVVDSALLVPTRRITRDRYAPWVPTAPNPAEHVLVEVAHARGLRPGSRPWRARARPQRRLGYRARRGLMWSDYPRRASALPAPPASPTAFKLRYSDP